MTDTCQENLSAQQHTQRDVAWPTLKASECTVTNLVNAFLLVHHRSEHRTERAALPFSTLQWSQTQETLSFTAALCRRAREAGRGWAGEERSGKRRKWRREREREAEGRRGRGRAARCCSWSYLSLHLPHYISLVCSHYLILSKRTTKISRKNGLLGDGSPTEVRDMWAERPGYKSNLINSLQHQNSTRLIWKTLGTVPPSFGSRQSGETFHNRFRVCLQKESLPHHRLMSDEP